jgi:ankyrin repeat protein
LLVQAGLSVDRQNPAGTTCLMYAASAGKTEVVEFMLRAGAEPGLQNQDGFTALDLAVNLEILTLLKPAR